MYDRATRQLEFDTGCTPEEVGPGSYDVDANWEQGCPLPSGAPFLSQSLREACQQFLSEKELAVPGPGHYDPTPVQPRVLGGDTLTTRTERFKPLVSRTPGPGTYNVKRYRDAEEQCHLTRPSPTEIKAHGKLIASRFRYGGKTETASIPTRGRAFGYEEQRDGSLRKLRPPLVDDSIGPAFYDQYLVETRATRQYRGIHFGKMGPRRTDLGKKSEAPGPGTYNVGEGSGEEKAIAAITAPPRPVYFIPRYNEAIIKETRRKNIPGPGWYHIPRQFDRQPQQIIPYESLITEPPPFLSKAQRFGSVDNCVPAPCTYNDPRNALNLLKRLTGLKRSPFGQTSLRFEKARRKIMPGPDAYSSKGMGSDSLRKAYHESTRKGVFGTTSTRSLPESQEAARLPGPAHYTLKEKPVFSRYAQPSAAFSSVTNRLSQPPDMIKDVPAPGSYNVARSYIKSQVDCAKAKPRTPAASLKHTSFISFAPRFPRPQDQKFPGPGTYENSETQGYKGGLMVYRDRRFKHKVENLPGPGSYEFSPMVQDTVLKGTFNVTLNNPLAQKPAVNPSNRPLALEDLCL